MEWKLIFIVSAFLSFEMHPVECSFHRCPSKTYHKNSDSYRCYNDTVLFEDENYIYKLKERSRSKATAQVTMLETLHSECELKSDALSRAKFRDTLNMNPDFIFLDVKFADTSFHNSPFGYLNNTCDYIDPFAWMWAHGKKGVNLLDLPVIFKGLSMGTLGPGVFRSELIIETSDCNSFRDFCDRDKLHLLAAHILNITREINMTRYEKDTVVCQDRAFDVYGKRTNTLMSVIGFDHLIMYQSQTQCYKHEGTPEIEMRSPYWTSVTTWILTMFIVIFWPVCTLWLIRKNPPVPVKDEKDSSFVGDYLSKETEIGIGLKHLLLYTQGWPAKCLRGVSLLIVIFFIVHPDILVRYIFDDNESSHLRWDAYYRMNYVNCRVHRIVGTILVIFIWLWGSFEICYLRKGKHYLSSVVLNNDWEKNWPIWNGSIFTWENGNYNEEFEMVKGQSGEPKKPVCGEFAKTGIPRDFVRRQMLTLLDYRQVQDLIPKYWSNTGAKVLACIIYTILLFPIWIMSFPGLDPLRRLLIRFGQFLFKLGKIIWEFLWSNQALKPALEEIKNKMRPTGVDDILGMIRLLLMFALYLRFLAFIALLAEMIVHTLTGLGANSETLIPFFIVLIFMFAVVNKTITGIHDEYYDLLCMTIKETKKLVLKNKTSFAGTDAFHEDMKGINWIENKFYWQVIDTCKPLKEVLFYATIKVFIFGLFVWSTFSVIKFAGQTNDFIDSASNIFSVVVYILLPYLLSMLQSRADKQRERAILKNKIKKTAEDYIKGHPSRLKRLFRSDSQAAEMDKPQISFSEANSPSADNIRSRSKTCPENLSDAINGQSKSYGAVGTTEADKYASGNEVDEDSL